MLAQSPDIQFGAQSCDIARSLSTLLKVDDIFQAILKQNFVLSFDNICIRLGPSTKLKLNENVLSFASNSIESKLQHTTLSVCLC